MKTFWMTVGFWLGLAASGRSQDFLDRVGNALTVSTHDGFARARVSGLVDVEGYYFDHPAPGLIDTSRQRFFNPRLTVLLDSQIGSAIYFFAQSRLDRGFDAGDRGPHLRLDEYALRVTPRKDGRLSVQIGKAPTVFGRWVERHLSWDNPFINAPLAYENTTEASDTEVPEDGGPSRGFRRADKYEYVPVIWGPDYATGASVAGQLGRFDYAAEVKNTALSARPEVWEATAVGFSRPAFSGRVGYRPDFAWNAGLSTSAGNYLQPEAGAGLPAGRGVGDYREYVIGEDVSYSAGHWQVWAEFFESRFELPRVGNLDAFTYYLETKYKFTPQVFGALRWNQQLFTSDAQGASIRDTCRVDTAVGCRPTPNTQVKLQYSYQFGGEPSGNGNTLAAQFTAKF